MKTLIPQEGYWITWKKERPIGQWEWMTRVDCPDYVDLDSTYKQITDEEKQSKEKEQEEYLNSISSI